MKALVDGDINTITNGTFKGSILIEDDKIAEIGKEIDVPDEAKIIDVKGKTIIPGLIEAHCHTGIHEEGEGWQGNDTNEMYDPITPHLRALDGINPDDIGLKEAVKAGITTVNVTPGSANPIGGQSVALKTAGSNIVDDLVLKEPTGMKMAFGENPKRVYREQDKLPSTRMTTAGLLRKTLSESENYDGDDEEKENFKLQALKPVLEKELKARIHAHRADDMISAIRIAEEFDFDMVLEHATEGHKIAEFLAKREVPAVVGPCLSSKSKRENAARTFETPGVLSDKGVKVALMTDSPVIPTKYLNLMAAYSVKEGMDEEEALKAITIYAAEICGIDHRVGSLEKGKDADIVVLDGDPLEIKSRVEKVFIEGDEIDTEDL
ncbi:MAG: amidohydrolase [Candidatus Thermoplasmatota archaeon]|nr:amidohydrolase [Candidatus Thermoplasmatota archaeon]MBS3790890.1 amidohydrolase [Candidatus Thermoplasmatota archaeon]